MPKFELNNVKEKPVYDRLSLFAQGYIEAMFFTNGDTGDENDGSLNALGVYRLTNDSIAKIAADCEAFWTANERDLDKAKSLEPGSKLFRYGKDELTDERLGNLFWYARQGHGIGFDDDGEAACLRRLQERARRVSECYVETARGWIYVR